jgi:hypothetical protein
MHKLIGIDWSKYSGDDEYEPHRPNVEFRDYPIFETKEDAVLKVIDMKYGLGRVELYRGNDVLVFTSYYHKDQSTHDPELVWAEE